MFCTFLLFCIIFVWVFIWDRCDWRILVVILKMTISILCVTHAGTSSITLVFYNRPQLTEKHNCHNTFWTDPLRLSVNETKICLLWYKPIIPLIKIYTQCLYIWYLSKYRWRQNSPSTILPYYYTSLEDPKRPGCKPFVSITV